MSPALEERFAGIIAGLHRTLRTHPRRAALAGVLLMLVWNRIGHLGRRFARLAARLRAGNLPKPRSRPASLQPPADPPKPPPAPPAQRLPPRRGWLSRLLPNIPTHCGAGASAGQLQSLLADPQMQALIAQAPEAMSRILRPLCHMLGVKPDPALLPPRQRRRSARPPRPARPPPEPKLKPRPRGPGDPPGRYAPGEWVLLIKPHWRDVLEGTVPGRRARKIT